MIMQLGQTVLSTPVTYPLDYKQLLYNGVGRLTICIRDNTHNNNTVPADPGYSSILGFPCSYSTTFVRVYICDMA